MIKKKLFALFVLLILSSVWAGETKFYVFKGQETVSQAVKADGVGVHNRGYIYPAVNIKKLYSPPDNVVWSITSGGEYVYAGVGNTGKIIRYRGKESVVLAEMGSFCVKALAAGSDGTLYVGGPDGEIFTFTPDGIQKMLFSTGEKYIWSLVCAKDGTCYAGTGPEGKIYAVSPEGQGQLLFDGDEKHILCLALDRKTLYAGSSENGLLYGVDITTGKGSILADIPGKEILSLDLSEEKVYVLSGHKSPSSDNKKNKKNPAKKGKMSSLGPGIYTFSVKTGRTELLLASPKNNIISMGLLPDGRVAAGSSSSGMVFFIRDRNDIIANPIKDIEKVLDIHPVEKGFYAATGKKGFICSAELDRELKGEIVSKPIHLGRVEKWGVLLYDERDAEEESIHYSIRCGRSENTEEGWTNWKEITKGELSGLPVEISYFQLKIILHKQEDAKTPYIKDLRVSYLPENNPPIIAAFKPMKKQAPNFKQGQSAARRQGPRAKPPKNTVVFMWKAQDRDGDMLKAKAMKRLLDEDSWSLLQKDIIQNKFSVDTSFIPEGIYEIKLVVSDEQSNRKERALETEEVLDEYMRIDRTPPVVKEPQIKRSEDEMRITWSVEDEISIINGGSYRINSGEWKMMQPVDSIMDEKSEKFSLVLGSGDLKDSAFLIVRFSDAAMNFSVKRFSLK